MLHEGFLAFLYQLPALLVTLMQLAVSKEVGALLLLLGLICYMLTGRKGKWFLIGGVILLIVGIDLSTLNPTGILPQ